MSSFRLGHPARGSANDGGGLRHHPRNVIYSLYGRVDLDDRVFRTPGLEVIFVTLPEGAASLETREALSRGIAIVAAPDLGGAGLRRAHQRLFADHRVRYLDCEGGETIPQALHDAGLLDEVLVTTTDAVIDESKHEAVIRIMDLEREGATSFRRAPPTPWAATSSGAGGSTGRPEGPARAQASVPLPVPPDIPTPSRGVRTRRQPSPQVR
jgi:riboflavin biosynthesis pyrimidine reductase